MSDIRDIKGKDFFRLETNKEKIKFLLQYAVLAPSTHNSQPWRFKVVDSSCEIYKDETKYLIEADKRKRNLYISIGCCVENIVIAAKYFNVLKKFVFFKEYSKHKTLVAKLTFKNLEKRTQVNNKYRSILKAITLRATNRGIFKNKKIKIDIIKQINGLNSSDRLKIHLIHNKKDIIGIAKITKNAIGELYSKKNFRKELSNWIYPAYLEKKEGISTLSLRIPSLVGLFFPLILRFFNISATISYLNYKSVVSLPIICIITAPEDNENIWFEVGRLAQKILLLTTSFNIDSYITVAAIDVDKYANKVKKILHTNSTPHFLFGLGYCHFPKVFSARHSPMGKLLH